MGYLVGTSKDSDGFERTPQESRQRTRAMVVWSLSAFVLGLAVSAWLARMQQHDSAVRRRADLAPPGADDRELVTLGAAWLGRTRLIDNLEI